TRLMMVNVTPWIMLAFASGSRTSLMIIHGVAPTAIAASMTPLSISRSEFSTIRAKNGIAATERDTLAAIGPMVVPVISFVSGISATNKMINGIERTILTIKPITALTGRFSRNK